MKTLAETLYGSRTDPPASEPAPIPHPNQALAEKLYANTTPAAAGGRPYLQGAAVINMSEQALQDKLGLDPAAAKALVNDTARVAVEKLQLEGRAAERFVELVTQQRTGRPRTQEELDKWIENNTETINVRGREAHGADAWRLAAKLDRRIAADPDLTNLFREVPLRGHVEAMEMLLERERTRW